MRNLIWVLVLAVAMINIAFASQAFAVEAAALCDAAGNVACKNGATATCPADHPYLRCFGRFAACTDKLKGGTGVNPLCGSTASKTTN